jgi:hypothetical protein
MKWFSSERLQGSLVARPREKIGALKGWHLPAITKRVSPGKVAGVHLFSIVHYQFNFRPLLALSLFIHIVEDILHRDIASMSPVPNETADRVYSPRIVFSSYTTPEFIGNNFIVEGLIDGNRESLGRVFLNDLKNPFYHPFNLIVIPPGEV